MSGGCREQKAIAAAAADAGTGEPGETSAHQEAASSSDQLSAAWRNEESSSDEEDGAFHRQAEAVPDKGNCRWLVWAWHVLWAEIHKGRSRILAIRVHGCLLGSQERLVCPFADI